MNRWLDSSVSMSPVISDLNHPGLSALTRIPFRAHCSANGADQNSDAYQHRA